MTRVRARGSKSREGDILWSRGKRGNGSSSKIPHDGTDDGGFTLIELVVVCAIIPIIVGAISAGLISVLTLQNSVANRLADTSDAQVISSTFQKDVQSASYITTSASSTPQCGSTSYTQLLGLEWDLSPTSSTYQTVVSYDIVPIVSGSTTTYSLVRQYCTFGNTGTPTSSTTAAFDVASAQFPPCLTSTNCTPSTARQGWTAAASVPAVKFVINEIKSGFTFTLLADSRSWTPTTAQSVAVGPAFAPLTVLSNCSGCAGLTLARDSSLTVNPSPGTNGASFAIKSPFANSVIVPDDATLGPSTMAVVTANPLLNSISHSGSAQYPSTQYYSPVVTDPLAGLSIFSTAPASVPHTTVGSCSLGTYNGAPTTLCSHGYYATMPSLSSLYPVIFAGFGTYEFQSTFVIPSNVTMTFEAATYIFDASVAIAPATLTDQTVSFTSANPVYQAAGTMYTPKAQTSWGQVLPYGATGALSGISLDSKSAGCLLNTSTGVVSLNTSGKVCIIDANEAAVTSGVVSYGPAAQVQQAITITGTAKTTNTITPSANPYFADLTTSSAIVGSPDYYVSATAGTAVAISLDPASSDCTLSNVATGTGPTPSTGRVDFSSASSSGTCIIDFNAPLSATYFVASQVQQVIYVSTPGIASITGNNVLFYVPIGSVDFGSGASVNLAPTTAYDGVAIWDATSTSTTGVSLVNIQDHRNSYGGIYIPGGAVNATSTSYDGYLQVMFLIANNITVATHTSVVVSGP